MEEKLTPELKEKLIEKIQKVVDTDVLNVADALLLIEVCDRALQRERSAISELYMENAVSQDE